MLDNGALDLRAGDAPHRANAAAHGLTLATPDARLAIAGAALGVGRVRPELAA